MSKTKKILLSLFVAMVMLLSAFALMGFTTNVSAYADSKTYFSDEEYTESDRLLNSDGSTSLKTIGSFSDEVKSASIGTAFPELAQVIPRQYLETSETDAVFQYNGKEYGYYVAKEGNLFDVLLIDFVYEFEDGKVHSDLEYKIRIKPILQQTFLRSDDGDGNYIWTKSALSNYRYYVANPRFLSVVQNENALNFSDNGYNKKTDKGAIIQSATLNFEGIVLEKDGITSSEGKALIQSAFCGIIDNVMWLSMVFVACSSDDSGDDKATLTKIMASGEFKTSYLEGEDFEKSNCKWANFGPLVFICFSSGYI